MSEITIKPAQRTLCLFFLVDCSGSMDSNKKMSTLNQVIRELKPELVDAMAKYPEINMKIGCIKFADKAEWHIGPTLRDLPDFAWTDLQAKGYTATAQAINLLCDALDLEKMSRRAVPPVCILLSDGDYTDTDEEYEAAIEKLDGLPWGKKAVRIVIAIGNEKDYNEAKLLPFTNAKNENGSVGVIKAQNVSELIQYIKWASVTASVTSSAGKSQLDVDADTNVVLPALPPAPVITSANEVF
jgi:uncharacterized protein YegL